MKRSKKYPMDGPTRQMQAIALNPKRTQAERVELRQYVVANPKLRPETKAFLTR